LRLVAEPGKCTGCRICELRCALLFEKVNNPKKARIKVVRAEPAIDEPVFCIQCDNPPCVEVCPTKALEKNPRTGVIILKEDLCIGCRACVLACPYGAIFVNPEDGKVLKCVACGYCTKYCPVQCLKIVK